MALEPPEAPAPATARDTNLANVRVVDLKLPFSSVLKFALQFFLCNLLFVFVLWIVLMLVVALLAGLGLSLWMPG